MDSSNNTQKRVEINEFEELKTKFEALQLKTQSLEQEVQLTHQKADFFEERTQCLEERNQRLEEKVQFKEYERENIMQCSAKLFSEYQQTLDSLKVARETIEWMQNERDETPLKRRRTRNRAAVQMELPLQNYYMEIEVNEENAYIPKPTFPLPTYLNECSTPYTFAANAINGMMKASNGPYKFTAFLELYFSESLTTIMDLLYCYSFINRKIILMISNSRKTGFPKNFQCVLSCIICRKKQYSLKYKEGSYYFDFEDESSLHTCSMPDIMYSLNLKKSASKETTNADRVFDILDNDIDLYVASLIITNPRLRYARLYRALSSILSYYPPLRSGKKEIIKENETLLKRTIYDMIVDGFNFKTKYEKLLLKSAELSEYTKFTFRPLTDWEDIWYNQVNETIGKEMKKNRMARNL